MHVVKITDGLGNQMFQYAFARKLQILTNEEIYLDVRFVNHEDLIEKGKETHFLTKCDHRKYGLSNFKIVLPIADDKILSKWNYLYEKDSKWHLPTIVNPRWIWHYKNEAELFTPDAILLDNNSLFPTYFEGYYFNKKYYEDITDILRKEFILKVPKKLPKFLNDILINKNTVSVHIRKGDFLKLSRDISCKSYYPNAFQWIEKNIKEPYYLIFSDDIGWVKSNIKIEGMKCYISDLGFTDYEEFAIMKHCKHNIIANSTYSYWAAYLNSNENKQVIYPYNWRKHIIPQGWIAIR